MPTQEQLNAAAAHLVDRAKAHYRLRHFVETELKPHVEYTRTQLDNAPQRLSNVRVCVNRLNYIINRMNAELYGGSDNPNTEEYK